ncbi:MAG: zinc-dependent metalloprotease, partial [Longimicrobiales bacterium]
QTPTEVIPAARQRAALDRLVAALQPAALTVPERIVALIPPAPFGYNASEWAFDTPAGPAFDPIALAHTLASKIVDGLLEPERAARLVLFHARDPRMPGLSEVVSELIAGTWGADGPRGAMHAALRRAATRAVVDGLINLAADPGATTQVRAVAEWHLAGLADALVATSATDTADAAFQALAARDILRFLERTTPPTDRSEPLDPPPGTPIGGNGG